MLPCRLRSLAPLGRYTATCYSREVACCTPQRSSNSLLPTSSEVWHGDLQIDHDSYRRKLNVIMKRLKEHLKGQKWPKLTHLEVEGRQFKLPIRLDDLDPRFIAKLEADMDDTYLAGFFDGDGCVSHNSGLSGCVLQVGQSAKNNRILFRYLIRHGGCISLQRTGCGSASPSVCWRASGQTAWHAASVLQMNCLVKKEQLQIATSWPACREKRKACKARMSLLKNIEPDLPSSQALSWTYLAGFFDAEGCIRLSATSNTFRLEIGQRHATILKLIHSFLLGQLAQHSSLKLYCRKTKSLLYCAHRATRTAILSNLLAHRLEGKRPEALLALNVLDSSHSKLRQDLALGKGRQSYFTRLDDHGCTRAQDIDRKAKKLRYAVIKCLFDADKLQLDLTRAKLQHEVLNSQSQIQKLRSFIAFVRDMVASPSPGTDYNDDRKIIMNQGSRKKIAQEKRILWMPN